MSRLFLNHGDFHIQGIGRGHRSQHTRKPCLFVLTDILVTALPVTAVEVIKHV